MKMEHFHYLLEISRLRSISAAARVLHIGQTTLSAIVKSTENELGFPVFQRTPNGVIPTAFGEHFMTLAWEINVKYEELIALRDRASGGAPAVTMLLCPALGGFSLPLSEKFYQFDLHGNLTYEEVSSSVLGNRIVENVANIGIAYLTEQEAQEIEKRGELNVERLLRDEICLLVPAGHRLAEQDKVDLEELEEERLVTAAKKLSDDKVLGNYQSKCKRITAVSSQMMARRAVLEQNMVSFMPKFVAEKSVMREFPEQYRLLKLKDTPRKNELFICLLTCKNRNLRYQERILAVCVRELFQALRPQEDLLEETLEEEAEHES